MEISDCINFILSNTQNAVFSYFKKRLQEFDVTPSQYSLLSCLRSQDHQTPSQLAQAMKLDTSSITGILSRMEKKDLIGRSESQEDRRSVSIYLLPEGRALLEQVDQVIEEANAKITRGLDSTHYEQLRSYLTIIENNTQFD